MAFKIFELGLKKYGDIPEYVLAYIDYLSHLNGKLWELGGLLMKYEPSLSEFGFSPSCLHTGLNSFLRGNNLLHKTSVILCHFLHSEDPEMK